MKKTAVRALALAIVWCFTVVVLAQPAAAATNEVLYLSDTMGDADGLSALYRVEIANGVANMILLPNGTLPYNFPDVISADPDGSKIWFIDDYHGGATDSGTFGYYSVADATVHAVGVVTYNGQRLFEIDQAAVAPDGKLYITDNNYNSLYTLDTATAVATLVGPIQNAYGNPVDIQGGDIAFGADGTLYLWVNWMSSGCPQGLYTLKLPAVAGDPVVATWIGGTQETSRRFTGLAVRVNGMGDLVGSITAGVFSNTVAVVDKTTGLFTETFPMMKDGVPFDHTWGDMSIGPFPRPPETNEPPTTNITFCTYTIGYWKNHSWEGKKVSILGVVVDEAYGKMILQNAKGKNMSMMFAQLIAAKLNVNNATGIQLIDAAEDYLVTMDEFTGDIVIPDGKGGWLLNWNRAFDSDTVKSITTYWAGLLDDFNNMYHCPDDAPVSANTTSRGGKKR